MRKRISATLSCILAISIAAFTRCTEKRQRSAPRENEPSFRGSSATSIHLRGKLPR